MKTTDWLCPVWKRTKVVKALYPRCICSDFVFLICIIGNVDSSTVIFKWIIYLDTHFYISRLCSENFFFTIPCLCLRSKRHGGVQVWVNLWFAFSNISFDVELLSTNLEQKSFIEVVDGWVVMLKLPSPMLASSELSRSLDWSAVFVGRTLLASGVKNAEVGTLGVCLQ